MTTVLTRLVARLVAPATLATAAAVLVKGYADTGDGFSAGAIAAAGVVLQFVALGREEAETLAVVRHAPAVAVAGLLIALAVAAAPLGEGLPLLTHHPRPGDPVARVGSLEIHTAIAFDAGVFLLVLGFAVAVVRALARTATGGSR